MTTLKLKSKQTGNWREHAYQQRLPKSQQQTTEIMLKMSVFSFRTDFISISPFLFDVWPLINLTNPLQCKMGKE